MSQSILILSPDVITERMAGPAIRYWEFAKALTHDHVVTLAIPNTIPDTLPQTIPIVQHTPENIAALVSRHDIILFQGYLLDYYPLLRQTDKILVTDLYDPIPLEGLEQRKDETPAEASPIIADQVRMMSDQLKLADYFLCASTRQRDLWLGYLMAVGRINPLTYDEIKQRVLTVPFGFPDNTPQRTDAGFRATLDNETKFVLLWGGGIWEWFDPLTLIRAVHRLLPRYPGLKLVFLGTQHPNPVIHAMPMQHRAEALARELDIYNTSVIFQAGWVPYDTLHNHLLDADVGVSAHFDTLETHFSFRTRILYYLWAGKPIITTTGDVLADEIAHYHAGIVVNPADEAAWVEAIEKLHDPMYYAACVKGVKNLAQSYQWSKVVQPLRTLCANASLSSDMIIENGYRKSSHWDCVQENNALKSQLIELEQQLAIMENSNSWRVTSPLRDLRRRLTHWKK